MIADHPRIPLGHRSADACLNGGLLPGVLHEVFAADAGAEGAATGLAAALAARVGQGRPLIWIRQDYSALEFGELSACGLLELGLDPARLVMFRAADPASALRAAGDALSCAALGAVIIEIPGMPKTLDLVTSRRLTLAAAHKGVTAFLLRFAARAQPSSAETRWLAAPAQSSDPTHHQKNDWGFPRLQAALVRNRHGATGEWVMEWNSDAICFREPAHTRAVVRLAGNGPSHADRAA
jgi:protein ImuA